jgi:hypothetical protein
MSRAIRYSSTSRQNRKATETSNMEDVKPFIRLMGTLIRDRFPSAQQDLIDRLALSMGIRRNRLIYRKRRFQDESVQLTTLEKESIIVPQSEMQTVISITTADTLVQPSTVNNLSATKSVYSETRTGTAVNQEQYYKHAAPSTVAKSAQDVPRIGRFEYPPMPKQSTDGNRICPYCQLCLTAAETSTEYSWRYVSIHPRKTMALIHSSSLVPTSMAI